MTDKYRKLGRLWLGCLVSILLLMPLAEAACTGLLGDAWVIYRFDNATATDTSGNARHGIITGGASVDTVTKKLGAGSFDFTGGYVSTPVFDRTTGDWCVVFWGAVDNGAVDDQQFVAAVEDAGDYTYFGHYSSDRIIHYTGDATVTLNIDTVAMTNDEFSMLWFCYDGTAMRQGANNTETGYEAAWNYDAALNDEVWDVGSLRAPFNQNLAGHVDQFMIFDKNLTQTDIDNLWNSNDACDPSASSPAPVISWGGYSPANNTRNNYDPWLFFFNVTAQAPEYCELYNSSTYMGNVSSVIVDKKYNFSLTLGDGSYEMMVQCPYSGTRYNSSVKYVEHDETQPPITFTYPLEDNSTVHINGTSMTFNISATDINLDGFNISVWLPSGDLYFNNLTDNLTGTYYAFERTELLNDTGIYTGLAVWWDDHNQVSSEREKEVSEYVVTTAPDGKVLRTSDGDIQVASTSGVVSLEWNGHSWSQVLAVPGAKAGAKHRIELTTSQVCRRRYSGHKGHLICGMHFVDFDGMGADVRLVKNGVYGWTVYLTLTEDADELRASSIGALNVNKVGFKFENNDPPVLPAIPDRVVNNTDTWYYDLNETDADGDTVDFYLNDSIVAVVAGVLGDSPVFAENGHYWVLVTAGDGYSNVSQVFNYTINITEAPAPSNWDTKGPTEFSSIPQALYYIFLMMFWFIAMVSLFVLKGPQGKRIQLLNILQLFLGIAASIGFMRFNWLVAIPVLIICCGTFMGVAGAKGFD